jgi:putative transposase
MQTVYIYQLNNLSHKHFRGCKTAQIEAAKVWNVCMEAHKAARTAHMQWPGRDALQKASKGAQFELHSQSVQMVVGAFLANIKTTQELRHTHPQMRMKYPWRTKRFYPVNCA